MSKRVVLTGGSGFVGANLARRLLGDGHELHLLLRPEYKNWRLRDLLGHFNAHAVNLEDGPTLDHILSGIKPDWIFHLAVHGAYSSQGDEARIMQTNFIGSMNLIQACAKANCGVLVNTSSSSEYGRKDHGPDESEAIEPNSAYAVSKAAATLYCRYAAKQLKMRLPTLRLYSVFGPWEEPTRLIPTLLKHVRLGVLPPLASPESAHDFIYVDDAVDAYLEVAANPRVPDDAVYNVGTGVQTTLRELVQLVKTTFHVSPEPVWNSIPGRSWDTNVWIANPHRIQNDLGWKPCYTLVEGLKKMAGWMAGLGNEFY